MQTITPATFKIGEEWKPLLRVKKSHSHENLLTACLREILKPIKVVLCEYEFYMIMYDPKSKEIVHTKLPLYFEEDILHSIVSISRPTVGEGSVYFDVAMSGLLLTYRWCERAFCGYQEVVCEDVSRLGAKQVSSEFPGFLEREGDNALCFCDYLINFDLLKRQLKAIHYSSFSDPEKFFIAVLEDDACVRVDLDQKVSFTFLDKYEAVTQDIIAINGIIQLSAQKCIIQDVGYVPI